MELGRIDITCEVFMMSSYTAMPQEGHLDCDNNVVALINTYQFYVRSVRRDCGPLRRLVHT